MTMVNVRLTSPERHSARQHCFPGDIHDHSRAIRGPILFVVSLRFHQFGRVWETLEGHVKSTISAVPPLLNFTDWE